MNWKPVEYDPKTMRSALRQGYRDYGEGSGLSWGVYPADATDDDLVDDGWDLNGSYGGPGRAFTKTASVRRTKTRVLVTQSCGLDI